MNSNSNTLDNLTLLQKKLGVLLGCPVSTPLSQQQEWRRLWSEQVPDIEQNAALLWAKSQIKGIIVPWPNNPGVEILMVSDPADSTHFAAFQSLLNKVFPVDAANPPVRFVVTGRLIPATSKAAPTITIHRADVGGGITLTQSNHGGDGCIALFVQDRSGNPYAVTCEHVLHTNKPGARVYSAGNQIGTLVSKVRPLYGQSNVSPGDGALVLIGGSRGTSSGAGALTNTLPPPASGSITGIASAGFTPITVVNQIKSSPGSVVTSISDITLEYDQGDAFFENVTTLSGATVEPGYSGSLGFVAPNATSLLIGMSSDGTLAFLLDMQDTLTKLGAAASPPLTLSLLV